MAPHFDGKNRHNDWVASSSSNEGLESNKTSLLCLFSEHNGEQFWWSLNSYRKLPVQWNCPLVNFILELVCCATKFENNHTSRVGFCWSRLHCFFRRQTEQIKIFSVARRTQITSYVWALKRVHHGPPCQGEANNNGWEIAGTVHLEIKTGNDSSFEYHSMSNVVWRLARMTTIEISRFQSRIVAWDDFYRRFRFQLEFFRWLNLLFENRKTSSF